MAKVRQFSTFENWKTEALHCDVCGWVGTFEQCLTELYSALIDCHCPQCSDGTHTMLAIVSLPTLEEAVEKRDQLPPEEQEHLDQTLAFRHRFAALKLKNPHLLPAIDAPSFVLHWDIEGKESGRETVIRHGERIIAREPALFEGLHRYIQVAKLLRKRYGAALRDLVPTEASHLYLWGDDLRAPETIDEARRKIFGITGDMLQDS